MLWPRLRRGEWYMYLIDGGYMTWEMILVILACMFAIWAVNYFASEEPVAKPVPEHERYTVQRQGVVTDLVLVEVRIGTDGKPVEVYAEKV